MTTPYQTNRLRWWTIGTLTAILFLLFTCNREPVELVFTHGPDESGAVQALIDEFNDKYSGKIHVRWQEAARSSNDYYRELEKEFTAESPSIHVLSADVVWTPAFAHNKWVDKLSEPFFTDYEAESFVKAALESASYDNDVWGVPWYTDAGILYYRKDLLARHGFDQPPRTWEELKNMASTITRSGGPINGIVFQGANYEGGVANACEFIWNAGGHILLSDLSISEDPAEDYILAVNSEETVLGLTEALSLLQQSIAPSYVATYTELECTQDFENGDAVFMRSWPTAYTNISRGQAKIGPEQVGVTSLPVSLAGQESYSCLGGWNLMVNAHISEVEKEAAWAFIQFMTAEPQQRNLAQNGGHLPTLRTLYEEKELLAEVPVMGLARDILPNARQRPITPFYMDVSPDLAWAFSATLDGTLTPLEAMETIEGLFQDVLIVSN